MRFVTDTHCLAWYLQDNPRLSSRERKAFDAAGRGEVVVPAIVLAELLYISRKLEALPSFEKTLDRIERCAAFDIRPLDAAVVRTAASLPKLEMHDALIAATARCLKLPLLTRDHDIIRSGAVNIIGA